MKAFARTTIVGVIALTVIASAADAHHAVQTVFDLNKPVTLTGAVTTVEWVNPHSYISVDVKADRDAVQHWLFELPGSAGVSQLRSFTAERGGLKPGDTVTVEGIASKDGTPTGFAYKLRLADGSTFDLTKKQHAR